MKKSEIPIIKNIADFFQFSLINVDSEIGKFRWIVRWRWVAITFLFFLIIPGYLTRTLYILNIGPFLGALSFLILFNLLSHYFEAQSIEKKESLHPLAICFQLTLDLFAFSTLLSITGGYGNPFKALFLLHAALGGILIRSKYTFPFMLILHGLLISLQIKYYFEYPGQDYILLKIDFASFHLMIIGTWCLMRSLGAYLEKEFSKNKNKIQQIEKQERLRALGALSAGFSHQFASPLAASKMNIEWIRGQLLSLQSQLPDYKRNEVSSELAPQPANWSSLLTDCFESLESAQASLLKCQNVIHSMNSAQLDSRENLGNLENINIVLKDCLHSWCLENPNAQIKVETTEIPGNGVHRISFAQVLFNLLDNAKESQTIPSPNGANSKNTLHENPLIVIKLFIHAGQIHLQVEDFGSGFQPEVLSRIGEPFNTNKKQGNGLGIYIADLFIQNLGGRLVIENKKNKSSGAIVTLTWPIDYLNISNNTPLSRANEQDKDKDKRELPGSFNFSNYFFVESSAQSHSKSETITKSLI